MLETIVESTETGPRRRNMLCLSHESKGKRMDIDIERNVRYKVCASLDATSFQCSERYPCTR